MLQRLASLSREFGRGLFHIAYPNMCAACGRPLGLELGRFCSGCRAALIHEPHAICPCCASTIGPYVPTEDGCNHCRGQHFQFDRADRLGSYEGLLREMITRMKRSPGELVAELIGALWAEQRGEKLRFFGVDVIIPIPLHWWRRWTRGYNQSDTLARALSTHLGIPCRPAWLRRTRHTPMQTQQTPSNRRSNVRGAFRARSMARLKGKTVLLVDDVMTTGSTCSEAARALRAAGASRVVVAVLAHGGKVNSTRAPMPC